MRLVEIERSMGNILIDKLDTYPLGLHVLRGSISIIPQNTVLFKGSIKFNLDPFGKFNDMKIVEVLEKVGLIDKVSQLPRGIYSDINDTGSSFSVGEKQLLCFARILLKKNKIVIFDEATAHVDFETD